MGDPRNTSAERHLTRVVTPRALPWAFDKCPQCGLIILNEETDLVDADGRRQHKNCWYDRLYLDLKGARERLCKAQLHVPPHWRSDLQAALDHIDLVGSAVVPQQWSKYDQPEYGGAS